MVFDYNYSAFGIEIGRNNAVQIRNFLVTIDPHNEPDTDFDIFEDMDNLPEDIDPPLEESEDIMYLEFTTVSEVDLNTLFFLISRLFPKSRAFYSTEYDYKIYYMDDDESDYEEYDDLDNYDGFDDEIPDDEEIDEDRPRLEKGKKDFYIFDPIKMQKIKYNLFSSELRDINGSNGMDIEFSDISSTELIFSNISNKQYVKSLIERAKESGYLELAEKIKDILKTYRR